MKRAALRATFAAACVLASGAAHAICQDPPGLVAERECLARELDKAERTMARYVEAARARTQQGWGEPLDLAPARQPGNATANSTAPTFINNGQASPMPSAPG